MDARCERFAICGRVSSWGRSSSACEDQRASLDRTIREGRDAGAVLYEVELEEARRICPVLDVDYVARAVSEPNAMHIDVAGVLDGFLRGFRERGGEVATKAETTRIERVGESWQVDAGGRTLHAPIVVNAAGAWCDEVGRLAGARPTTPISVQSAQGAQSGGDGVIRQAFLPRSATSRRR